MTTFFALILLLEIGSASALEPPKPVSEQAGPRETNQPRPKQFLTTLAQSEPSPVNPSDEQRGTEPYWYQDPQWVSVIVTIFIFLATLTYAVFAGYQWSAIKRQGDIAEKTARAAQESADAATKTAKSAERAAEIAAAIELGRIQWTAEMLKATIGDPAEKIEYWARFVLRGYGKSAVTIGEIRGGVAIGLVQPQEPEYATDFTPADTTPPKYMGKALDPQTGDRHEILVPLDATETEITDIEAGKAHAWIPIRVIYQDAMERQHTVGFAIRYSAGQIISLGDDEKYAYHRIRDYREENKQP